MSAYLRLNFRDMHWPKLWLGTLVLAMATIALWVVSLFIFGFSFPIFLLAMAAVSALVFVRPEIGLSVIILSTMWFERWFTLQPIVLGDQVYKLYPLDIVMTVAFLGFLFHQAFGRLRRHVFTGKLDVAILVFMVISVIYLLYSLVGGGAETSLAFSAFKNYAFYAVLFWLVALSVQNRADLVLHMRMLLVGGFGILAFVFIGLARGEGLWTEYTPLSTEGVRLLAFPHAFYLSLVLIISLVLLMYRLRPERASLFIMWAQLVGVIGSLMRHIWVSLALVAAMVWLLVPKTPKKNMYRFFARNAAVVALLGVLLVFIVTIFPLSSLSLNIREVTGPLYARARSLVHSAADSSARWRIYAWRAAQESIIDHPIAGIGYGQELSIDFETYFRVIPIRDLHNSYLVLAVQMGLLGALSFAALIYLPTRRMITAWRAKGLFWPYQLAFFSALMLFLLAALWQPYFETNLTGIFFWILLGLLAVSFHYDEISPSTRD